MTLADEITEYSRRTFKETWQVREGKVVPSPEDIPLNNTAVHFKTATILYADLDQSTSLVEDNKWTFAAEIYKTFLYACSRVLRSSKGTIVSYDGDRVMGVFIGGQQRNEAVACALKINYAIKQLVQPKIQTHWKTDFTIRHVVGIDTSEVRVTRTGVRGDNDLVWVGKAPNKAAKLTAINQNVPTFITESVYSVLAKEQKLGSQGEDIWKKWNWNAHNDEPIWSTTYWRSFN